MVLVEFIFIETTDNKYENPPVRAVQPMTDPKSVVFSSLQLKVKQEISLFYIIEVGIRDGRTGDGILVGDSLVSKHVKTDSGTQIAFCTTSTGVLFWGRAVGA
jgi:hypothetical protein